MRNAQFWRGFAIGALALVSVEVCFFAAMYYLVVRPIVNTAGAVGPPPFPNEQAADYSLNLSCQDGTKFSLKKYEGKVILLNMWASWCSPCITELPSLQRLKETMKADPSVEIVCVNIEGMDKAKKVLSERDIALPAICVAGELPRIYRTSGIPATFIISQGGTVVFRHVGRAKWDDPSVVQFLKKCKH